MSNTNAELRRCRYSALDWLGKCPAYIWLIYKEGLAEFRHPAAQVGTAVHEVLHTYADHCFKSKRSTDDEEYDAIVSKQRRSLPTHLQSDYLSVCRAVKGGLHFQQLAEADSVHIENRLAVDRDFNPTDSTSYFSGGIDLYHINGDTAYAYDYKTSREAISDGDARASLQREIYSWLILKHHPDVEEVWFSFVMSRYSMSTDPIVFSREDDLPEFETRLRAMVDEYYDIISGEAMPKARPGSYCVLCGCMSACPAYHQAFAFDERIGSPEEAETFVNNFLLAEHKLKHWKGLAEQAVEAYGDIPCGGDRVYGNKPSVTRKYDYGKVMNRLAALDVDPEIVYKKLGVTSTELKGICKAAKIPIETFDVFSKSSLRNSYASRKAGAAGDDDEG